MKEEIIESRQKRAEICQKIITEISKKGRIKFIDNYINIKFNLHQPKYKEWNNFSHGGTLRALILDMKEFIMTGHDTNHNNGYGGLYCPHWGYSENDMQEIQEFAKKIGYLI